MYKSHWKKKNVFIFNVPCATKLSREYITCVNEHYTIHERKSHSQNAVQLALPGPFQFSSLSLLREDASRTNLVPFRLAWNPVSSTLFRNAFALNTQSTFTFVHFLAPKFGTQFVSDFCAWFVNHWIRSVRFVYDTNWRRRLQNALTGAFSMQTDHVIPGASRESMRVKIPSLDSLSTKRNSRNGT